MPDIVKLLWPKVVAVVGASSDKHGLRGRILETMLSHPFDGTIYPVSRSAAEVQGLKAYPSVADLPQPADLAILIIPAEFIPDELERCGRAGVKAAVVLSSGFAEEKGGDGAQMQRAIRDIAKRYDMAVTGPNAEGFANIANGLIPTFSPAMELSAGPIRPNIPLGKGQVSVISQSGGVGFAFFDRARERNLTFRYVVTTGNEAALETSDLIDFMLDEGKTDVFLVLLEDVKTPQTFHRVAEKAMRLGKPLIVCKIGQSEPGRRAVASHTAALAGSHAAYRAIFQHYGVIEGSDFDEMLDLAAAFITCGDKLPAGKRMAICTASGGAGVWMADACVRAGLEVPELDAATRATIDAIIPSYGTSQNPIDSTAQGVFKLGYAAFAKFASDSPVIDGVMVVVTARRSAFLQGDQAKLIALAQETKKPVFLWSYTVPSEKSVEVVSEAGYPLFKNLDSCARAMRVLADFRARSEALAKQDMQPVAPTADRRKARDNVSVELAAAAPVLCEWYAMPFLSCYDIGDGHAPGALINSAEDAETVARNFGCPVALKVQSADIPHKTEAGGVALNVTAERARAAYERVLASAKRYAPTAIIDGVLVQKMARPGREVILGVSRDDHWGPLLMVGLGGTMVEALGDVALAPVPLDHAAARALLARLKAAAVLGPWRGQPAADIAALAALMVNLSHFAHDHVDSVAEIDLNPVIVHNAGEGLTIVDALIVKRQSPAARAAAE
ncbi:MAG TPA: acetate--CoA ligase family protein [Pseudolabrys sp.]